MYRTNQKMTKTYKAGININVKLESPIISLIILITSTKNIMKINKDTVYRVFFPPLYTCKQFHPRLEFGLNKRYEKFWIHPHLNWPADEWKRGGEGAKINMVKWSNIILYTALQKFSCRCTITLLSITATISN